jgi:hypothetical protein
MKYHYLVLSIPIIMLFNSCNFEDNLNNNPTIKEALNKNAKELTISDFNYKISLIEIQKKRFGEYPDSLKEIKFLGYWDNFNRYKYSKIGNSYELNVILDSINYGLKSSLTIEDIRCNKEFWKGLDSVKSNLR